MYLPVWNVGNVVRVKDGPPRCSKMVGGAGEGMRSFVGGIGGKFVHVSQNVSARHRSGNLWQHGGPHRLP